MKHLLVLIFMGTMLGACFFEEINPQDIVGKWTFTGFTQELKRDGITWSPWKKIATMNVNDFYEFKSDGKFNYSPRTRIDSCIYGENYITKENNSSLFLTFTNYNYSSNCAAIDVFNYPWILKTISKDTLLISIGDYRSKYARTK